MGNLAGTKANVQGQNLLMYISETVKRLNPEAMEWVNEFDEIALGAQMAMDDFERELDEISKPFADVQKHIDTARGELNPDDEEDKFLGIMGKWEVEADDQISGAQKAFEDLTKTIDKTKDYYKAGKDMKWVEFAKEFTEFQVEWRKARTA